MCIFYHATVPDGITAQLFTLLYKTSTDFTDASVYADNGNEMFKSRNSSFGSGIEAVFLSTLLRLFCFGLKCFLLVNLSLRCPFYHSSAAIPSNAAIGIQ